MSKATKSLKNIFARINSTLEEAMRPQNLEQTAQFVIDLVVKRTRLGYGVNKNFGEKYKFPSLSPKYIKFRKSYRALSDQTSASKSNVTLTGQLLNSIQITKMQKGTISFGPSGRRNDSKLSNADLSLILEKKGRTFLRVSQLEVNQTIRFYRKTFGDLLDKKRLLR